MAEAPTPAAREGERKQVTVLFADVVGSMELAEQLDADELTEVMQGLFAVCTQAVQRYGGTVDKFTGDGVMALFGAPIAQEDHAARACRAALDLVAGAQAYATQLRARRGLELAVRVGLNSGEVVAGAVGGAGYTAVGHTVGLAQRMESLAESGSVNLSEHTAALVAGAFRVRDLGSKQVKGSSVPVGVFVLEGVAQSAGRRRLGSVPLIGRDDELAALRADLDGAMRGDPRVVSLAGEAGAGKSRLSAELVRYAAEQGVPVGRTAGVSHAMNVPLLPIRDLVRDHFDVVETDTQSQIREKMTARMLGLDSSFAADLPLMFDFIDVPDPARPAPTLGAEARRRRILEIFRRVTTLRSARGPSLQILEDLHWFDQDSVRFLEQWLPSFVGTRTMVLTNFRPEFRPAWAGLSFHRPVRLTPLAGDAIDGLLVALLGTDPSLDDLVGDLRTRIGGNPFFAEEIVRSLSASGTLDGEPGTYRLVRSIAEVTVPTTVQGVLAGRIDRLPGRDKSVLQAAAVIGRTFTEPVLRAVAGQDVGGALAVLGDADLIAVDAAGEYRFWHPLTREVAYGTLLAVARRRLHGAVAGALITVYPERVDELTALIATHYDAADDHLEAGRWHLRAATRGLGLHNHVVEARRLLRAAIDHLDMVAGHPEAVGPRCHACIVLLRLGGSTGMDAAETERLRAIAAAAVEQLGDPALRAVFHASDGVVRTYQGDQAGATRAAVHAIEWADRSGRPELRVWTRLAGGFALAVPLSVGLGQADEALVLCGSDVLLGTTTIGYSVHDPLYVVRGMVLSAAGPLPEARMSLDHAIALFEERPMFSFSAWALSLRAQLAYWTGEEADVEPAGRDAELAVRHASDIGSVTNWVTAQSARGIVAGLSGRLDEAAAILDHALARAREQNTGLQEEPGLLAHLAEVHLARGETDAARAAADEAVAVARRQGARVVECVAHLIRARVFRATAAGDSDLAQARAAATTGALLAAEVEAGVVAAFLAEEQARLDGDNVALRACAEGYAAIGATGHARRLSVELAATPPVGDR